MSGVVSTLYLSHDAKLRLRIETTIQRLIDLLDTLDADSADCEPSLGWTAAIRQDKPDRFGSAWGRATMSLDAEDDGDGLEPPEDGETAMWSNDPAIPQDGPAWHHYGS